MRFGSGRRRWMCTSRTRTTRRTPAPARARSSGSRASSGRLNGSWKPRPRRWREAPAARRRSTPRTTPSTGASGRLRGGRAGRRRAHHDGGHGELAGLPRGTRHDELQGDRRLQAHDLGSGARHAAGAEHGRATRPQGHGVQQRQLSPRPLSGDEPLLRRPRLLLRGPVLPARGTCRGTPLEGLREGPARDHRLGPERSERRARRSYPFQGEENPFTDLLERWGTRAAVTTEQGVELSLGDHAALDEDFYLGTTSVQAADAEGWVVSITPSGGWIPAVIAGETGIGLSQRAQSFVLDEADNPYNVIEPGKRPRATLTPGMALRDGRPFLSFAVQGRGRTGPEPAPVLPERGRVGHERAAGGRSAEHEQLSDARFVRPA